MDNTILFKILQLDSLVSFLDWTERVIIHTYINNKAEQTTPKILAAYLWIETNEWEAPQMEYKQDRLLYFFDLDSETWLTDEYYLKLFPEYKTELNKLKI
jgi:hypothetical protein